MKPFLKQSLDQRAMIFLFAASVSVLGGCAGYQLGGATMYRSDVRTVRVPMFQSETFRRGLGEQMTEAVVKQLRSRSNFIVINDLSADSVLTGRVLSAKKRVLAENVNDEPRNLELDLRVEVTWTDRFGQVLFQRTLLLINNGTNFIPEAGQSVSTAMQQAIQRTARQIVNEMEFPW